MTAAVSILIDRQVDQVAPNHPESRTIRDESARSFPDQYGYAFLHLFRDNHIVVRESADPANVAASRMRRQFAHPAFGTWQDSLANPALIQDRVILQVSTPEPE